MSLAPALPPGPAGTEDGRGPSVAITAASLDRFRRDLPDCALALWADIDTGLVLAADGDLVHPQEYLDAICAAAARALSTPGLMGGAAPDRVVTLEPAGDILVLRDARAPAQALVCLCAPGAGPDRTMSAMAALLAGRAARGMLQ